MSDVKVEARGQAGGTAIAFRSYVTRALLENISVVTEGTGIRLASGGHLALHDVSIQLVNGSEPQRHCGLRAAGYCRIWYFGGRIGTGYGYDDIVDAAQDVIGLLIDDGASGRIQLHDIWSICRQDNGSAGTTLINCVRLESEKLRVRIHGGYMQAEGPDARTLASPGNGRIEIYGARIRDYGSYDTFSSNQIGLSRYTAANHDQQLPQESGGLILCDADAGPFRLYLPSGWVTETEQYIFKKSDQSTNVVTIQAVGGQVIEGSSSRNLTKQYDTLHLRLGGNVWYLV
jgi:hypothetical protein